ncbi:hypothetical protein [Flammeovirga sp. SJP92]|uniref:hypothetical protein n=1 Tax=Flammeovirga sp. SJP92 TaxID=1775430 RepID=UPI000787CF02|nr:hypothetical protein [Flammeovirga sp. SJP92]KXX67418.1 hypothetical protein AVL50_26985 [Flammeovirga sp. SJP92]
MNSPDHFIKTEHDETLKLLVDRIKSIAQRNKLGFTFDLSTKEIFKKEKGYIIAFQATQNKFDNEGIKFCIRHALKHQKLIGGWHDPQNFLYYFDSVMYVEDKEEAIRLGRENKQISIFDFETSEGLFL